LWEPEEEGWSEYEYWLVHLRVHTACFLICEMFNNFMLHQRGLFNGKGGT
jgi:hypothetical protein